MQPFLKYKSSKIPFFDWRQNYSQQKNVFCLATELAHWLRASTAHAEDQSLVSKPTLSILQPLVLSAPGCLMPLALPHFPIHIHIITK